MKKVYEIADGNVIESMRHFINFTPDDAVSDYDFYYVDNKNVKRKINIKIRKEIAFHGEDFFNRYQIEARTYINNKKIGYHCARYISYESEDDEKFSHVRRDRLYKIDYIFYKISEFIDY